VFARRTDAHREAFVAAMDSDFNTAAAIASLFDIAHTLNSRLNEGEDGELREDAAYGAFWLKSLGDILGIFPAESGPDRQTAEAVRSFCLRLAGEPWAMEAAGQAARGLAVSPEDDLAAMMAPLLRLRQVCRELKQYALSDRIRDELKTCGVILEDTKDGARWKLADG
jgi:cysteinyl-tRNA synthetase